MAHRRAEERERKHRGWPLAVANTAPAAAELRGGAEQPGEALNSKTCPLMTSYPSYRSYRLSYATCALVHHHRYILSVLQNARAAVDHMWTLDKQGNVVYPAAAPLQGRASSMPPKFGRRADASGQPLEPRRTNEVAHGLAAQVAERDAARVAKRQAELAAERADDERVVREQAAQQREIDGEIARQRQREAEVRRREDWAANGYKEERAAPCAEPQQPPQHHQQQRQQQPEQQQQQQQRLVFMPSEIFQGRQLGYVFTTRHGATGYYDDPASGPQQQLPPQPLQQQQVPPPQQPAVAHGRRASRGHDGSQPQPQQQQLGREPIAHFNDGERTTSRRGSDNGISSSGGGGGGGGGNTLEDFRRRQMASSIFG